MVRIGLDSFSYNLHMEHPEEPQDVFWFLQRIVDLGLNGCQVDPRHLQGWDPDVVSRVGDFCRDNGLYLDLGTGGFDSAYLAGRLEVAHRAGAGSLRTFFGGHRHQMKPDEIRWGIEHAVEGLLGVRPSCEATGVKVGVENHEEFTADEILEIVQRVNHPMIGACLDSGNTLPVGDDPVEATRKLAPHTVCMHFKDWRVHWSDGVPRWEHCPLGEGEARAAEVFTLLRELRPELPITIENPTWGSCAPVTREDEEHNVTRSVEWVRDMETRQQP